MQQFIDAFLARYVFDLAFDGIIKASVVSHPSFLKTPEDFEVSPALPYPFPPCLYPPLPIPVNLTYACTYRNTLRAANNPSSSIVAKSTASSHPNNKPRLMQS